jgi:hypothetical protein
MAGIRTPHIRYVRHRDLDRLRHSTIFLNWLNFQATRLSLTVQQIFNSMKTGLTAAQISNYVKITNKTVPTITGTATVGQTLTAGNGTWNGAPKAYAYVWKRDGTAIAGATAKTYLLVAADATHVITVTVTAADALSNASATSAGTAAVAAS